MSSWLRDYLAAWSDHCKGNAADAENMCKAANPAIEYGDINLPSAFEGHDGIRTMCGLASQILPGAVMRVEHLLADGSTWAIRWILEGKHEASGKTYSIRGSSWGTLDGDGKVKSQLDMWNPGHFEAQTGTALF